VYFILTDVLLLQNISYLKKQNKHLIQKPERDQETGMENIESNMPSTIYI